MKKEVYITPEMEVTCFEAEDILTSSLFEIEDAESMNLFDLLF